jgi:hypothetical protein
MVGCPLSVSHFSFLITPRRPAGSRSGSQHLGEGIHHTIYLLAGDDEGREEAQDGRPSQEG